MQLSFSLPVPSQDALNNFIEKDLEKPFVSEQSLKTPNLKIFPILEKDLDSEIIPKSIMKLIVIWKKAV